MSRNRNRFNEPFIHTNNKSSIDRGTSDENIENHLLRTTNNLKLSQNISSSKSSTSTSSSSSNYTLSRTCSVNTSTSSSSHSQLEKPCIMSYSANALNKLNDKMEKSNLNSLNFIKHADPKQQEIECKNDEKRDGLNHSPLDENISKLPLVCIKRNKLHLQSQFKYSSIDVVYEKHEQNFNKTNSLNEDYGYKTQSIEMINDKKTEIINVEDISEDSNNSENKHNSVRKDESEEITYLEEPINSKLTTDKTEIFESESESIQKIINSNDNNNNKNKTNDNILINTEKRVEKQLSTDSSNEIVIVSNSSYRTKHDLAASYGFNEDQIGLFEETFQIFDKDRDGNITFQEIKTVMNALGFYPNDENIIKGIQNIDNDNDGTVDFEEFICMMSKSRKEIDQELQEIFQLFDRNKDGFIDKFELKDVLIRLGENISDDEVFEMIREADTDGDNKVSLTEFRSILRYDNRVHR